MRYTTLLTSEVDPNVFVAYVPVLGIVTQGATVEAALEAAREATYLEIMGRLDDNEDVPVEPAGCIVASSEVEVPVPAAVP